MTGTRRMGRCAGMTTAAATTPSQLRRFWAANAVVSAAALSLLAYILVLRPRMGAGGSATVDLTFMPAVNAALNATSATLLCVGLYFIRQGRMAAHRAAMLSALGSSALFLVGYLAYHFVHGDTRYPGSGLAKVFYLCLLASHVLLSIPVVPMALAALFHAFKDNPVRHKKVTRWLFPIWLYVSVTGVAIFFLLRGATPALPPS
jgi:putative membrane protein